MPPRRFPLSPVGTGPFDVPYDQGGAMSDQGLSVPTPQGPMRKMSFEFHDPAQAAAAAAQGQPQQPQAPVQPNGPLPPGAQPAQPDPSQQPQQGPGQIFGAMANGADQFGQGPDSSMFTDDQLAAMLQDQPVNPVDLQANQINDQMMSGQVDPELQMRMMDAARRMGGF